MRCIDEVLSKLDMGYHVPSSPVTALSHMSKADFDANAIHLVHVASLFPYHQHALPRMREILVIDDKASHC
jgi:hypothetical protein